MTGHIEVALPLPVPQTFTYSVEGPLPAPGTRVLVPFQRTKKIGWVLGKGDPTGLEGIRELLEILDESPSVPEDLLRLARWIAEYYIAPLGVVLRAMLPPALSDGTPEAVRPRRRQVVRVTDWLPDLALRAERFGRARRQLECFEHLLAAGGSAELAHLERERGFSRAVVHALEEKGVAVVADEEVVRDPFQGEAARHPERPELTEAQSTALEALLGAARSQGEARAEARSVPDASGVPDAPLLPFLLHGVTGSGKTQVYIELLREVVERRGRSAIVLVPEIALTPQTVGRFRAWFGDEVAVLHSALSDGERYDQWRLIRRGERRVVVGARSAIFAPVPDLGAVIVDEEHDGSYKQSEAPRYHGRDVAVYRAALAGAVCVLGSATPALESWWNVKKEKFRLLSLPERVSGRKLPPVEVVDLRVGRAPSGRGGAPPSGPSAHGGAPGGAPGGPPAVLSPRLVDAVRERLDKGEQSLLLLNRRGYSAFVQCRACGEVRECENCSITLTFHRARRRLVCHHCRHEEAEPDRCFACGAKELSFRGLGTEQVERVVAETFPTARIARMDLDTTSGRWSHHEILGRVERGEVDLLLGTQMIAKGLDFPGITLVGVVNADVGMHLPDFRATERTFQLLSQVAGRAGRGEKGGEVIVQSSLPDHYAIRAVVAHDVPGFVERELRERRDPAYPPYARLVNVVVSSPDRALVADAAEAAAGWMRKALGGGASIELVGPAPSPIERLHRRWRWHFFLRGGGVAEGTRLLTRFAVEFRPPAGDVRVAIDRDPVALL